MCLSNQSPSIGIGLISKDWKSFSLTPVSMICCQVSKVANKKYLDAVALADFNGTCIDEIEKLCQRIENGNRTFSGVNPLPEETELLFRDVFNGGNHINGFTNASIRKVIFLIDAFDDDKKVRNKVTGILANNEGVWSDFKNSSLLQMQNYSKRNKDNYCYFIDQKTAMPNAIKSA